MNFIPCFHPAPPPLLPARLLSIQQQNDPVEMTSRAHSSAQILPVDPISLRVKAEILTMSTGAMGSLIQPRLSSFPFLGAWELSAFLVLVLSHTWARSPGSTHLGISPHPLPFTLPRNPSDCTSLLSSQMLLPILSKLQTSLLPASLNYLFSLGLNTICTYTHRFISSVFACLWS